jgi:CheY-like chemotaxis protein
MDSLMTKSRKRILVVEDYVDLHEVYRTYVGRHHEYDMAISAPEAISLISSEERYDHILCDYHLADGTNGTQVYDWVKGNRPELLEEAFVFLCGALDKVSDFGIRVLSKGDMRALQTLIDPSRHSKM